MITVVTVTGRLGSPAAPGRPGPAAATESRVSDRHRDGDSLPRRVAGSDRDSRPEAITVTDHHGGRAVGGPGHDHHHQLRLTDVTVTRSLRPQAQPASGRGRGKGERGRDSDSPAARPGPAS